MLQNSDENIKILYSANYYYDIARRWRLVKFIVYCIYFLSLLLFLLIPNQLFGALSSFVAMLVIISSKFFDYKYYHHRKIGAEIQQYFDVNLFSFYINNKDKWGEIKTKSQILELLVSNEKQEKRFENWYNFSNSTDLKEQIFYCQSQNIRWSKKLYSYYKTVMGCLTIFSFIFFVLLSIYVSSLNKMLVFASVIIPFIDYWVTVMIACNDSFEKLSELEKEKEVIEQALQKKKLNINTLISLQYKIFNFRKSAYIIPNLFYNIMKANLQKREEIISHFGNNKVN